MISTEKTGSDKKGRKSRSVVWLYFDKSVGDPFKSTCKLCNLVCNNASNTTNLFSHLRVKHPAAYEEAKAHKEAEIESKSATCMLGEPVERKPSSNSIIFKDKGVKRPRSVVWYYFDKDVVDPLKAKCKICGTSCVRGTNTTNLFNHLKVKHPATYREAIAQKDVEIDLYLEMKGESASARSGLSADSPPKKRGRPPKCKADPSLTTSNSTSNNMSVNSGFNPTLNSTPFTNHVAARKFHGVEKVKNNSNKLLLSMIAGNLLQPSIVELKGFKDFVKSLDSRYELPSKKNILKKMLPELSEEIKSKIKLEVHIASCFALTVETWVYRQSQHCCTLMAHFIKDSWEPASVVLETFDCTEKNSGESVSQEMKRITDEWGISDKVVSVVSMQAAANIREATLSLAWEHLSCFGQMLNMVVQTALDSVAEIARIKKKTMEVVSYFTENVKASDTLLSVQQHHTLPEHKLKQEVEGRWRSTFSMMSRMVEQFEAVNTVLCFLGKDSMCLCDDEVELMRLVVEVLRPFDAATKELCTDEFAAMSKVIPLTTLLQQVTMSSTSGDSQATPEPPLALRRALLQQMQTHFADLENNFTLAMTTLLDPRFKHHAFTDTVALETAQNRLLLDMISTATSSETVSDADTNANPNITKDNGPTADDSVSIWNIFDRKVSEAGAQKTTSSEAENESRRYFKEAIISRSSDPLQWWKLNQVQFPHLKVLAQKYLCIPANSMCSSRLLSTKGTEFEVRRNKIKPSNLHTMVFLSSNV